MTAVCLGTKDVLAESMERLELTYPSGKKDWVMLSSLQQITETQLLLPCVVTAVEQASLQMWLGVLQYGLTPQQIGCSWKWECVLSHLAC